MTEIGADEQWNRGGEELSHVAARVDPNDPRRRVLEVWLSKADEAWLRRDFKQFLLAAKKVFMVIQDVNSGSDGTTKEEA